MTTPARSREILNKRMAGYRVKAEAAYKDSDSSQGEYYEHLIDVQKLNIKILELKIIITATLKEAAEVWTPCK